MTHGVKLADGTFIENGTIGKSKNRIELAITAEDASRHLLDLMDYNKTKWIGFYVNQLVAEYVGYGFIFMQRDDMEGKVQVWLEKQEAELKGEQKDEDENNSETGSGEEGTEESTGEETAG